MSIINGIEVKKCSLEKFKMLYNNVVKYRGTENCWEAPNNDGTLLVWINDNLFCNVDDTFKILNTNKQFILMLDKQQRTICVNHLGKVIKHGETAQSCLRKLIEMYLENVIGTSNSGHGLETKDGMLNMESVNRRVKILSLGYKYTATVLWDKNTKKILTDKTYTEIFKAVVPESTSNIWEEYTGQVVEPWYSKYDELREKQENKVKGIVIASYLDDRAKTIYDILNVKTGKPIEGMIVMYDYHNKGNYDYIAAEKDGAIEMVFGIKKWSIEDKVELIFPIPNTYEE